MRSLLSYLGIIMVISGAFISVPALAALILGELWIAKYFIAPASISMGLGYYLQRREREELDLRTAFILCAVAWLLAALIGSIPYIFSLKISFLDAYFETMSGFTTTGITVLTPSELPRTIIFWRSLTEWIGGVGIVLVFLAIMAPTTIASKLYIAEARTERIEPSILRTTYSIFYIYLYFTLIGVLALYLAGAPVFDAVNHALTSLPTGGFSPHDNSYADMSPLLKVITMILMLCGGISFAIHQRWLSKDFRSLYTSLEVRALVAIVILFSLLLHLDGMPSIDAFFQGISALTTSGFASIDVSSLSDLSKCYLIILMNIGGGYGATASGIKLMRFVVVIKAVEWFIKRITSPTRAIIPFKVQSKVFTEEEVFTTLLFCLLYISFLIPSILIFVKLGHSFMDSVFMISSAQGNNGLVTLTTYTSIEKVIMIFHMWIGRLEIIPVLVLLTSFRR